MSNIKFDCSSPQALVEDLLDGLEYFNPEDGGLPAIPAVWTPGKGKLVIVVGDNAGGKSFFRRIVGQAYRNSKIECMDPSMQGRVDGYNALRSMVYGNEQWQATGENSTVTVIAGVRTCRGREHKHAIFWDEPDLGLSDSWAAGMGQYIRDFALDPPKKTMGIFVVTHNKALVRELLPAKPHYLHLGRVKAPNTVQEWLDQPVRPLDLTKLRNVSRSRFRRIHAILKS